VDAKKLYDLADKTFTKKLGLVSLQQEIAMNFYPERADFTYQRSLGTDFAANLMTSYPLLVRRELGDQIGQMLRPTEKPWFHMATIDERLMDNEVRQWVEWMTTVMRRAMYDRAAMFNKAEKQGDHDFAAFGQDGISVQLNRFSNGLQYNCWHLRDLAWTENEDGAIATVFRKWKPTVRELRRLFPKTVDPKTADIEKLDPMKEMNCIHMVVEAELYDKTVNTPYISVYYDIDNQTVLEAVGSWDMIYSIERWMTVSGSQYAFSPATVAALPEARLLQAMTYTLLEAGEKATNPPWALDQAIFRSDVAMYAGGLTWADLDGDSKIQEHMQVMVHDKSGIPIGEKQQERCQRIIADAFYLNALRPFNPATDPQMTAFQAGQIVQDYIRKALPLFEPMEAERNASICEATFGRLLRGGAFGPTLVMPRKLRMAIDGKQIMFKFKSPLHDSIDQMKSTQFLHMKQLTAEAVALDPAAIDIPDAITALRDALNGAGIPAAWTRGEAEVTERARAKADAEETAQFLAAAQGGADVAKTISESQKNIAAAQPAMVQ
jgi:hypothetical protein